MASKRTLFLLAGFEVVNAIPSIHHTVM